MSSAPALKGAAELDKFLSALPKNMQKQAYRQALTAAATPILKDARARAQGWSPKVAKAITKGSSRQNQDGTFSIRIYVNDKKPDGFLGVFAEYGVAPHLIARTGAGEGRVAVRKAAQGTGTVQNGVMKIGNRFVSGIIQHPGHAAHPFLLPALDAKTNESVQAFGARIRAFLENKTGFVAPTDDA